MASLTLFLTEERDEPIPVVALGEVLAPKEITDVAEGEPIKVFGRNDGDTNIRELAIYLEGEGARNCQLARDESGAPGIWAAPGESVMIEPGTLYAGNDFEFWLRGVFHADDSEGTKPFDVIFRGVST